MIDDSKKVLDDSIRKMKPILKKSSSFFDMIEIPVTKPIQQPNKLDNNAEIT